MSVWKRYSVARIIMILMIVIAIIYGNGRSLRQVQAEAERVFYEGEEGDYLCIASDVYRNWEIGCEILNLAEASFTDATDAMQELDDQLDRLARAEEPAEILEENDRLEAAVRAVCEELDNAGADADTDMLLAELLELNFIISRDTYFDLAEEANQALRSFPGNILKPLTGVREMEIYQSGE